MDPDEPNAAAFWRLMAHHDLLNSSEEVERKWGLVILGIALMTPTGSGEVNPETAHKRLHARWQGPLPRRRIAPLHGLLQRGSPQPNADLPAAHVADPAGPDVPHAGGGMA